MKSLTVIVAVLAVALGAVEAAVDSPWPMFSLLVIFVGCWAALIWRRA